MDQAHLRLLADVAAGFAGRRTVVIGAVALVWHFGTRFRKTVDLDLCIAIDLAEHTAAAGIPVTWQRRSDVPHRWRLPDGQLVDILPASDDLLASGHVHWPNGMKLDLTGIDLAMRDAARCSATLPQTVMVASRRALFVTKIAAWLDRPADRQKDLEDLGMLLDCYAAADDPRLFDEPALGGLEWDERPACLLGLDLRCVCTERHEARIRQFVERIADRTRREHHWMLAAAPAAWRADETGLTRRLHALLAGLGDRRDAPRDSR